MKLPQFLYKAISKHNSSLGDNEAFPYRETLPFDYTILKQRFNDVVEALVSEFNYELTVQEAEYLGSKILFEIKKREEPLKPQLEKLAKNVVCDVLGVPMEIVILDTHLVDKIEPNMELRILPEDDDDSCEYSFEDIDEMQLASKSILHRRFFNSLIQGVSYSLAKDYIMNNDVISDWNETLPDLYRKLFIIHDYLLFVKEEKIIDKDPSQGSYVETHLGTEKEKTVIDAQGLVFPFLLQETFRGFFELFSSHGLPEDKEKARYIMRHADFILAEPWDLRMGVGLWVRLSKALGTVDTRDYAFIWKNLVEMDIDEFNLLMKNVYANTKKGGKILSSIVSRADYERMYVELDDKIDNYNITHCMITDDARENKVIK